MPAQQDDQLLHYRQVRILGRRMGAPADPDLAIINGRFAAEPLTADDLFTFDAIASSDAYDDYYTRMDPETTLPNYEVDLAAGQALLDSHDNYRLPFGSSFRAQLQPVPDGLLEGVPASVQLFAGYYMLRNHVVNGKSTEDYRTGILGGTLRKMSIGFKGNDVRYICDVDGSDLYDWKSDYYPGMRLPDGTIVTYTIKNARAAETSLVSANGSPGALIQRVQALIDQRQIPPSEITRLEGAWGVRFAGKPTQFFTNGGVQSMDEKQIRALLDGVLNRAGKKLSAATREKLSGAVKSAEELIATISELLAEAESDAEAGRAARTELGEQATPDGIRTLRAQAKAGEAYTKRLIDETMAAKTAVLGDAFTADKAAAYRTRLERMAGSDFAFIEEEHASWSAQRKTTFRPGRPSGVVAAGSGTAGSVDGTKGHSEFLDYGDEEGE